MMIISDLVMRNSDTGLDNSYKCLKIRVRKKDSSDFVLYKSKNLLLFNTFI